MFLCYDSPAKHPRITAAEREDIESKIGEDFNKRPATPWKAILTSLPVWACAAAHFANNWGYYTLLTCLPTYMKDVLKFDIEQNGVLSGLPYFADWIVMTLGGQLADLLRKRQYLSTRNTRKLFNVTGLLLPGLFLILAGFTGCNHSLSVAAIIIAVGLSGLASSGYAVNHLDLAPSHAGTLMGLTNAVATIPGFAGPQVVGALTQHESTREQWQKVFYITLGIYCFGALVYAIFGAGEPQKWSRQDKDTEADAEERSDETEVLLPKENDGAIAD